MDKLWIKKTQNELYSKGYSFLLIFALIMGSYLINIFTCYAEDKSNLPTNVKLNQQEKATDEQSTEKMEIEKNGSEKGVRKSVSSESVVKSQSQRKKVPAFWVLFPE